MKTFQFSYILTNPTISVFGQHQQKCPKPEYIISVGDSFLIWQLEVQPSSTQSILNGLRGNPRQVGNEIQLSLCLIKTIGVQNLTGPISCQFELLDFTDSTKTLLESCNSDTCALHQCLTCSFPFNSSIPYSTFGKDNQTWIRCTLKIPDEWFEKVKQENTVPLPVPVVIPKVVSEMFNDVVSGLKTTNCAVTLITSDKKEFNCHSCYLVKQSPVLKSMIDGLKGDETEIVLDDIDGATLMEVLRFIYTETVSESLKPLAPKLLYAVEKYMLPDGLKDRCHEALETTMHVDNAIEYLLVADTYGLKKLKAASIDTIVKNLSTIRKKDKWMSLIRDHPFLVDDIFEATCENNTKSMIGFSFA